MSFIYKKKKVVKIIRNENYGNRQEQDAKGQEYITHKIRKQTETRCKKT